MVSGPTTALDTAERAPTPPPEPPTRHPSMRRTHRPPTRDDAAYSRASADLLRHVCTALLGLLATMMLLAGCGTLTDTEEITFEGVEDADGASDDVLDGDAVSDADVPAGDTGDATPDADATDGVDTFVGDAAPCETCESNTCGICDDACIDLGSDENNCGACGRVCDDGANVDPNQTGCGESRCDYVCVETFESCVESVPGCETDTATSKQHCGECGNDCTTHPNVKQGATTCEGGTCAYVCQDGFEDCTQAPGCETDLTTDVDNCGMCGNVCPNVLGIGQQCNDGVCAM